ncbi:MAG: DUF4430 domain-containing protein [Solirubrobacteraceae bacterium]|nr:MAG: hypothetical protein DLM63_03315 [Solirubrobacterales bacterium]
MKPILLVIACAAALAASGCGLGPGPRHGGASVLVTSEFGTHAVGMHTWARVAASDTVMRLLERSFTVDTRYGGGFVQTIDGVGGGQGNGGPLDWFYYVNGIEAGRGAAVTAVHPGDRIWWDRHDWGAAMSVPAVVGSFPEPFLRGVAGKRLPVRVDCAQGADVACRIVEQRFASAGVIASSAVLGAPSGLDVARVLVGLWSAVASDPAAQQLAAGPSISGVYARVVSAGHRVVLLDENGHPARTLGPGTGIVAATRFRDQDPTWVVTGTDSAGIAAAAEGFDAATLDRHFAVAFVRGRPVSLPLVAP